MPSQLPRPAHRAPASSAYVRRLRSRLGSLCYAAGLMLVFALSLLLLPADSGLGKLLRVAL